MSILQNTLADYGRQLGIDRLQARADGALQLELASGVLVGVEAAPPGDEATEVLVFQSRALRRDPGAMRLAALQKAHFSQGGPYPIQLAGSGQGTDSRLIAITRIPIRDFTPQALGHAVDYLSRWLDEL
jgi:type III secretion system chaperone SycN